MKKRILFIYLRTSSFVREDLDILGDAYEVVPFRFGKEGKLSPVDFASTVIRQFFWLLRELPRASAVYGWFADYHMVLPAILGKLFGRRVAVAVGGFDAISLPSLDYGVALSTWRRPLNRFVLKAVDLLLPVSPSLIYSQNGFSEWPLETEQGVRALVDNLETDIRVLPTGYDSRRWPLGPSDRTKVVATVGLIDSDRTLRRKGIDLLIETARRMDDVTFRIIGVSDVAGVSARYHPPENVTLIPPVARDKLVRYYHEAAVYAQLSRAEGLPNVLCEAMLCGCVPVGSRAFGIPDGVGDVGYVVDAPDPSEVERAIRRALAAEPGKRDAARRHIESNFSLKRRRESLLAAVDALTRANRSIGSSHADPEEAPGSGNDGGRQ